MTQIVSQSTVGIDLHTGSDKRTNLPQIRADLDDPRACELTEAFGAPIAIHSRTRDGSLRQAANDAGATVLLYEGGEASRFDQRSIDTGMAGVLRVLAHLEIIEEMPLNGAVTPQVSRRTLWSRATRSGITHLDAQLGERVERFQPLASIYDPYGKRLGIIRSRASGMVIGHTQHPLVNRGDAVSHVAVLSD
jgi:predicted deacylase